MQNILSHQHAALETWGKNAIDAGWLTSAELSALDQAVIASPAELFSVNERPLVVGFFGGTGVGKSTLLNRFAEEAVADASAVRPTSQHITVYVHQSITVENLPNGFPVEKMRTAIHKNDSFRQVIFIDMPDFDSVETSHREQVSQWLPHLDIVLYVVSPERYRDDQGWQILLQSAHQHAWIFVMNQWDRGDSAQLGDFTRQLGNAGLNNPLIFCTDSLSQNPNDDFTKLRQTLLASADQVIINALNEHGIIARLRSLKTVGDQWLQVLPSEAVADGQPTTWEEHWSQQLESILSYQHTKSLQFAQSFKSRDGGWLALFRNRDTDDIAPVDSVPIDENLLQRFDYALESYLQKQHHTLQIPVLALQRIIEPEYQIGRQAIEPIISEKLGESLAKPGSSLQRTLYYCLGKLSIALPFCAMAWIAWRVVTGFTAGATDSTAYLGLNFTINAVLLVGLSWLIPSFLHAKTRPSASKAALIGLETGIRAAHDSIQQRVSTALQGLSGMVKQLVDAYQRLWSDLEDPSLQKLPGDVKRMLADEVSSATQRSLDVRATTQSSTDAAPAS